MDERLGLSALMRKYGRKVFPVHCSFFLGEMALFSFLILVLTGTYLGFMYVSSNVDATVNDETLPEAYASVRLIESIPVASPFRNTHHGAANVMIESILLHLLRIFFTGTYLKPREINWAIGVVLLGLSLTAGIVRYALPYDSYAVTATGIGFAIARSIPFIGEFASELFFGGAFPTLGSLARLYTIHVFILPALITVKMGVHPLLVIKQKHTQPGYARKLAEPGKVLGVPLIPYQALLAGQLFFLMFGALFLLSAFVPPHPLSEFGPPQAGTPEVKPDWYLLWTFGFLKIVPPEAAFQFLGQTISPNFLGGLLFPALIFGIMTSAPWMDRSNRRAIRRFEYLEPVHQGPVRTAIGVAMLTMIGTLFLAAYYDEIGMSLSAIWAVVIILPILTGLLTWFIIRARSDGAAFDAQETFESLYVAPGITYPANEQEVVEAPSPRFKDPSLAIRRAPDPLKSLAPEQQFRLLEIATRDGNPKASVIDILKEAGEWKSLNHQIPSDEAMLDILESLESVRPG